MGVLTEARLQVKSSPLESPEAGLKASFSGYYNCNTLYIIPLIFIIRIITSDVQC